MPFKNLPEEAFRLWEQVYEASKKAGDSEKVAARKAWTAVKKGWKKGTDGRWHKKAELSEFALTVKKAYVDSKGQKRWRADASDTAEDSYSDNMSLELFADFLSRIESREPPPEQFRSDYWAGGMPYLSVSHYHDQNGEAVPGEVEVIYVDGNYLKAKGIFYDTPLGEACFKALCEDLERKEGDKPRVRVSIAFLDYKHKHKATGYVFERKSITDFCPECIREMLNREYGGKIYLRGHLIHLALTRVPVNKRTLMEVDRSMTTQLEDAVSIIGEELAQELEEKEKALVGKSEALVIRSEEVCPVCEGNMVNGTCEDCGHEVESPAVENTEVERAAMKTVDGEKYPASDFLVVEDPDKPSTWHLQVKRHGKPDHHLMAAARAALTSPGGHRGNRYQGPQKEEAIRKLKRLYKEEGMEWDAKSDFEWIASELAELKAAIMAEKSRVQQPQAHVLDEAIRQFRSDFDSVLLAEASADERLKMLQDSFNTFAAAVIEKVKAASASGKTETSSAVVEDTLVKALSQAIAPLAQKLDLISTQLASVRQEPTTVPLRRSIAPAVAQQAVALPRVQSPTPNLRALIEKTT